MLYILFMSVLHLALGAFAYIYLKEIPWAFLAAEVLLLASIAVAVYLYSRITRPIRFVRSGIEAIKDKDFGIKFVPTGKGEIDTLIEVYNLMIDELRAERIRANEQHHFLEKLIEVAPVALLILDFDGRIASYNQRAHQLFGLPDSAPLMGRRPGELGGDFFGQLEGMALNQTLTLRTADARTYRILRSQLMDRGFPRTFFLAEEITAELAASEKKTYGVVIRMMAHEVNNTLGATNSILQSAVDLLPAESYRPLQNALAVGIERNNRLAGFMRNFADVVRLPLPNRQELDLPPFLTGIVHFIRSSAEAQRVGVTWEEPSEPIRLQADPVQMEQVLVNILKNALEACGPGNSIGITLTPGRLQIRNDGQPISEEEASRLFTPFYTTKPQGQGIGLTLTKEILQNHGFGFSLRSVGPLTTFEINW